jgi:hypothetical protein
MAWFGARGTTFFVLGVLVTSGAVATSPPPPPPPSIDELTARATHIFLGVAEDTVFRGVEPVRVPDEYGKEFHEPGYGRQLEYVVRVEQMLHPAGEAPSERIRVTPSWALDGHLLLGKQMVYLTQRFEERRNGRALKGYFAFVRPMPPEQLPRVKKAIASRQSPKAK